MTNIIIIIVSIIFFNSNLFGNDLKKVSVLDSIIQSENLNFPITSQKVTNQEMTEPNVTIEHLAYSSSFDSTAPLYMYVGYPDRGEKFPLIICMHGFNEDAALYVPRVKYLVNEGWFTACVEMRGRDASAGKHDSGGIEVHDIYDAVCALKKQFGQKIDFNRIGIQGWSGGGGNVSSAMTKLPDTFNAGASFFGIPDYEHWQTILVKRGEGHTKTPAYYLGVTPMQAPDKYMARNSTLGVINNPYSKIFLFNDTEEFTCLPEMDAKYKKNADDAGLDNVELIISDPNWPIRTWHYSKLDELKEASKKMLIPLKNGNFGKPKLNMDGNLVVLGFIITENFSIYCGDGQDAVAKISYKISENVVTLHSEAVSSDKNKSLTFRFAKEKYHNGIKNVLINGKVVKIIETGKSYLFSMPSLNGSIQIEL